MSVRSDLADRIAAHCKSSGLDDAYGVGVGQGAGKGKPYLITFCKAGVLDGAVTVYSPTFILVKWMTQFRDMPHKGHEKFGSEAAALAFINTSFVR